MTAESRRWRVGRWIVEESEDRRELWVELADDPGRWLLMTDRDVAGLGAGVSTVAELAALIEGMAQEPPPVAKPSTLTRPAGRMWVDAGGSTLPPSRRRT